MSNKETPDPQISQEAARLLPCPFCGAGETDVHETRLRPRMDGKEPALVSVEIRHWCAGLDGLVGTGINFRGRDHESAIAAWNRRAVLAEQERGA